MSVLDVADWFLTLAEAEEKQLEHMQLQRLCCYAQGFALALYGEALFGNPIEVAEDGPMVREVWDSYGVATPCRRCCRPCPWPCPRRASLAPSGSSTSGLATAPPRSWPR